MKRLSTLIALIAGLLLAACGAQSAAPSPAAPAPAPAAAPAAISTPAPTQPELTAMPAVPRRHVQRRRCSADRHALRRRHDGDHPLEYGRITTAAPGEAFRAHAGRTRLHRADLQHSATRPTLSTFDSGMANHTVDDLRAAIAFVREQGAQKLVLVGASLGGMATAKAAAVEKPAAMVIMSAPADLLEFDFQVTKKRASGHHRAQALHRQRGRQNGAIRRDSPAVRSSARPQGAAHATPAPPTASSSSRQSVATICSSVCLPLSPAARRPPNGRRCRCHSLRARCIDAGDVASSRCRRVSSPASRAIRESPLRFFDACRCGVVAGFHRPRRGQRCGRWASSCGAHEAPLHLRQERRSSQTGPRDKALHQPCAYGAAVALPQLAPAGAVLGGEVERVAHGGQLLGGRVGEAEDDILHQHGALRACRRSSTARGQ